MEPIEPGQPTCEICGTEFLWSDNPAAAERKMKLTPTDPLGKEFLAFVNKNARIKIHHFSKPDHKKRWDRAVELIPDHQIRDEVNRCAEKSRGYGLIKHVLNSLEKLVRDGRVERAPVVDPLAEYVP